MRRTVLFLIVFCIILLIGCSNEDILKHHNGCDQANVVSIKTGIENESIGVQNAIKKARQLTDIEFTPLNPIECNATTLMPNETYKGMIYSSVKELETYIGENVSFHTFMTAIHNPRSKIYTERVNEKPYHGKNCRAYYGTVCSGLVSYALGLNNPRMHSVDFPLSNLMEEVNYHSLENLHFADVLWRSGHVALITDIQKNDYGLVTSIEISEAAGARCKRYYVSSSTFLNSTMQNFTNVYRYKDLAFKNDYISVNEFVAVADEIFIPYEFNKDLCVDKGDKSCYLEGEKVIINVFSKNSPYGIEIYKDNHLYIYYEMDSIPDMTFDKLPYGDYCARVVYKIEDESTGISPIWMNTSARAGKNIYYSDYTYWKVVNTDIHIENNKRIEFESKNSTPIFIYSCDVKGNRPPISETCYEALTETDKKRGYFNIDNFRMNKDYPYIRIVFSTDYGNIVSTPINWFE